jgi:hypothetical protein
LNIEIVWREMKIKTFKGKQAKDKATAFVKTLAENESNEEIEIFEIDNAGNVISCTDIDGDIIELDG